MKSVLPAATLTCLMLTLFTAPTAAQKPSNIATQAESEAPDPAFARFVPSASPNANRIDYSIWDEALSYIVFRMGRSLRQDPGIPSPGLGSRRIYGHDSRYRLEGNRITFSLLNPKVIATFTEYREDLERTADLIEITSLGRNEQLAFWINLHNVAVIEQVALGWPVRQPRELQIDGVPLDDARFITVRGVKMSPRDIRTRIVYPNWKDPRVIYGFFRGEIGGPSIQPDAFDGENVGTLLESGAHEFVNSLRGTQKSGVNLLVSRIYEEARPFYFRDWPTDLRAHVARFADDEVTAILNETSTVQANIYEADIADMAGGVREPTYSYITSDDRLVSFRIPQGMQRMLREHQEKVERAIRSNRRGTVTFSNIRLPGDQDVPGSIEVE